MYKSIRRVSSISGPGSCKSNQKRWLHQAIIALLQWRTGYHEHGGSYKIISSEL